ncbi:ABC transporter permease [Bacteroides sp.]
MIKQTIRQALVLLRQNPLMSIISILGTALAISMIMVMVITWQTKYADMKPEVNRGRSLYISATVLINKSNENWMNSGYSSPVLMKECIWPLKSIEAVTVVQAASPVLAATSDGSKHMKADYMNTDDAFWKIYDFRFLSGRPFVETDKATPAQGRPVVVAASVARRLFGTTDVAGKLIKVNREQAYITGVVEDVSLTCKDAYSQIWTRYDASALDFPRYEGDLNGEYHIVMLARSKADFPAIRQDVAASVKQFNYKLKEFRLDLQEQPDDIETHVNHVWSNRGPDMIMIYLQYIIALVIILLVPSLNLCGLSNSRMQQRMAEMGVRKAFGATRGGLIRQVLNENLILSLLGGIVGLLFSYLAVYCMRTWLFANASNIGSSGEFSLNMSALFSPVVFGLALLFCVIMNLLSAGIPAWNAARRSIVTSLNDK